MTYDERLVAEARERLLPEIEKTRRTGSSDYWRVRQDVEGLKGHAVQRNYPQAAG